MTQYKITVNNEQLGVLIHACEVYARLGIGQFRDALECLPIDWKNRGENWHEAMLEIGNIMSKFQHHNIDGWRTSLSICADLTSDRSKAAWDLYQVMRHRLAWDGAVRDGIVASVDSPRDWSKMMGVHYDEPFKASPQPLAKMEQCE